MKLRSKLFLVLAFIIFVSSAAVVVGYFNMSRIAESSKEVIEHDVPVTRAIKISLTELLSSEIALESALGADDFLQLEKIRANEIKFEHANLLFSVFINALAWGSETDAFAKSGGGLNIEEWKREGLTGNLIIKAPTPEEAQLAGAIDIYFGGYVNNAYAALANHKKLLRLRAEGKAGSPEATAAELAGNSSKNQALHYASLISENLDRIVELTNANVVQMAADIDAVQKRTRAVSIYIFLISSLISLAAIYIFMKSAIIGPLGELVKTLKWFGSGDLTIRAHIKHKDEFGYLAGAFNKMADDIQGTYSGMQLRTKQQNQDLQDKIDMLKLEKESLEPSVKDMTRTIAEQKAEILKIPSK